MTSTPSQQWSPDLSPPNNPNNGKMLRNPSIDDQLKHAIDGIKESLSTMARMEEKALSGHYADRLAGPVGYKTEENAAYQEKVAYSQPTDPRTPYEGNRAYGQTTLDRGISGGPRKVPEFTPPHVRVMQAEARVTEARIRLEALVERLVGPVPLADTADAGEPNPWGGHIGEGANAAQRIKSEAERINWLLRALETTLE